jgi:drug/metabolite transporter (DMT)-like permease
MMTDKLRAYFHLHFCVFLWGFTAILGKLITLQALPLVWWRVLLCCATLWFFTRRTVLRMPRAVFLRLFGIGLLVGLHWLCFYGAIKLSNASVAVTTMAATAIFSALCEPLILRRRIKWYELALGIFILPGMALVVGNIDLEMRLGFAVGIVSAFLAAVFTALNKKVLDGPSPPPPLAMSFSELFGGVALTSAVLPLLAWQGGGPALMPQGWDWLWLLILAWACTLLPYYLTLRAMRHISAFAINLTLNLEPVYGVVLAGLIFREDKDLNTGFYIGVAIILLAVFGHPFLKKLFEKSGPAGSTAS